MDKANRRSLDGCLKSKSGMKQESTYLILGLRHGLDANFVSSSIVYNLDEQSSLPIYRIGCQPIEIKQTIIQLSIHLYMYLLSLHMYLLSLFSDFT
jgi:hypothetical protein